MFNQLEAHKCPFGKDPTTCDCCSCHMAREAAAVREESKKCYYKEFGWSNLETTEEIEDFGKKSCTFIENKPNEVTCDVEAHTCEADKQPESESCTKKGETSSTGGGETSSTQMGKIVHTREANNLREQREFDLVSQAVRYKNGNIIFVPYRINSKTGKPIVSEKTGKVKYQKAIPDAVNFEKKLILDIKPYGRNISKDKQEIIRFIVAFWKREGCFPLTIAITRYDPATGDLVQTDLYSPEYFIKKTTVEALNEF